MLQNYVVLIMTADQIKEKLWSGEYITKVQR